jgi:lipid II:glycine glycyltransferase (peptidoglycan interpeptide bridge formation enzyme)
MSYNKEKLEMIIKQSCDLLLAEQPMLFQKSADINERTISGELSSKIRAHFSDLHVNCEYNRMTDENGVQIPKRINLDPNDPDSARVFPDIIMALRRFKWI